MTSIDPTTIKQNSWTENLGSDFIAVDTLGNVLARANDRAGAEKAAPDNAGVFSARDLVPQGKQPKQAEAKAQADLPKQADVKAEKPPAPDSPPEQTAPAIDVIATGNPFDHDGDGSSGGSKAGEESTAAVGAARKRKPAKDAE